MFSLVVESREARNNMCAIENNCLISGRQGRLIHIDMFCLGPTVCNTGRKRCSANTS